MLPRALPQGQSAGHRWAVPLTHRGGGLNLCAAQNQDRLVTPLNRGAKNGEGGVEQPVFWGCAVNQPIDITRPPLAIVPPAPAPPPDVGFDDPLPVELPRPQAELTPEQRKVWLYIGKALRDAGLVLKHSTQAGAQAVLEGDRIEDWGVFDRVLDAAGFSKEPANASAGRLTAHDVAEGLAARPVGWSPLGCPAHPPGGVESLRRPKPRPFGSHIFPRAGFGGWGVCLEHLLKKCLSIATQVCGAVRASRRAAYPGSAR